MQSQALLSNLADQYGNRTAQFGNANVYDRKFRKTKNASNEPHKPMVFI